MSIRFEGPTLRHRYLFALLSRLRRFINQSVASAIASRERHATRFAQWERSVRESNDISVSRVNGPVCVTLLGLAIASSIYPASAKAEQTIVAECKPCSRAAICAITPIVRQVRVGPARF